MFALGLLITSTLSASAAPPDPWSQLAFTHSQLPRPAEKHLRDYLHDAGKRESAEWHKLETRAEWEKYRDVRLAALRKSLGTFPAPPKDLKVKVRKTLEGDDCRIDCLTFESRPGLLVTANLYRPALARKGMPGIAIVHSHHNPKTEGELQDMGMMWARAGCYVLVMDQLGHGERRQHPFVTAKDYAGSFRPSRQDYFFRYNLAIQLQTIGDSLMGWMVWDIMRGVDLLLAQPGIDAKKIILLGSVAGGGDPCAVAGALDERIACVGPFNFGGPQPENRYPLPDDAETSFLYSGSGSWESTRNLAYSAKEGFLPWVIVGAIAPRKHIYGHEFTWNKERDPVWKRLTKIHGWYGGTDSLVGVYGAGSVKDSSSKSTHCNNIGAVHRRDIHVALKTWFGIDAKEVRLKRWPAAELLCLEKGENAGKVHEIAGRIADERMAAARTRRATLTAKERMAALRKEWQQVLGIDALPGKVKPARHVVTEVPALFLTATWFEQEQALLLRIPLSKLQRVTVLLAQGGPRTLLRERSTDIRRWTRNVVALPDLGGTSNQPIGTGRGRSSGTTSRASSSLMLGRPELGAQLHCALIAVARLHAEETKLDLDLSGFEVRADFAAPVNLAAKVEVPLDAPQPHLAEPNAALVALLCALFDERITSVSVCGGLVSSRSLLDSPFVHVPYDAVIPGVLATGDLVDVVAALAPRPVRLEGLVDGLNRKVPLKEVERIFAAARQAYRKLKAADKLVIVE